MGEAKKKGIPVIWMTMTQRPILNTFAMSARVAGWLEDKWVAILISCLVGPAQKVVDTVPPEDVANYGKVRDAILKTLNQIPEAYYQLLHEVSFGPDYHVHLVAQKIRSACLSWLHPTVKTTA